MTETVLIIGATGGIGSEVAAVFAARGARLRVLHRDPDAGRALMGTLDRTGWAGRATWVEGDAMDAGDVVRAAEGVSVIFHGANPPGYKKWRQLAVPMLQNSIEAARASGARLVFPGNIYNFGPGAFKAASPMVSETLPQKPKTRRGKIRVRMEKMLLEASRDGVKVLIVRAGDFFGPHAPGSWFGGAMVKPGKPARSVTYPGRHDAGHAWAFLPDLAETMVRLVEREAELAAFEVFHFGGHYFERGVVMAEQTLEGAGARHRRIKALPWGLLRLAAPFSGTIRGLLEMRYLWRETIGLDNAKLVGFLGAEPHTDLDSALRLTLEGLDCL